MPNAASLAGTKTGNNILRNRWRKDSSNLLQRRKPLYCDWIKTAAEGIVTAHEMKGTYRVFVMVNTSPGSDEKVAEQLLKFKEVTEVHFISGIYDLLVVVEASLHGRTIFTTIPEISQLLIQKIRKIEGVRDTNTLLPFRSLAKRTK